MPGPDILAQPEYIQTLQKQLTILRTVLDESTDPIFNILEDGTYRYVNHAFASPFGLSPDEIIGRNIRDIFSPEETEKRMAVVRKAFITGETIVFEVKVPADPGDLFYLTSVKPDRGEDGRITSVICISKDITERKRAELEREKLIEELREALTEVRTLSGLLPICANCKQIRDDKGYWTQIEEYIERHSHAQFTHGICPTCAAKIYPEFTAGEESIGI